MSLDNVVTVTFSEPVKFADYNIMETHLETFIDGPKSPYSYTYSIVNKDSLVANQTFTELKISITNVQATLFGNSNEEIQIWWTDLSVITDRIGNNLTSGKIVGNLNQIEYLSPSVQSSAENGGESMKLAILSLFSVNLIMKLIISSSAAIMWSLIHVLQAIRYILMINIKMPKVIDIMMKYLVIIIGEVEEIENLIPDIINIYFLDSSDLNKEMHIRPNFQKYGYETPYLTDLYGKQIFVVFWFIFVGIPIIYFGMKLLSKVPYLGKKFINAWGELFWNTPLRTFIELFIEIAFGFFLHTQNIRFLTITGVIATIVLFFAGSFVLLYPFVILTIISKPPLYVKRKSFEKKYGTLTEDVFKKKTLLERAYYPLFITNRIFLTWTIVLVYRYPLLQLATILLLQIMMIYYLIWHRPFRSELQEIIVVSDEITVIVEIIFLFLLFKDQHDIEKSARIGIVYLFSNLLRIGMVIWAVILWSLVKNFTIIIYLSVTKSYIRLRNWFHGKIKNKSIKNTNKPKKRVHRDLKRYSTTNDELMFTKSTMNWESDRITSPNDKNVSPESNNRLRRDRDDLKARLKKKRKSADLSVTLNVLYIL